MTKLIEHREKLAKNMHSSFFGCFAQQNSEAFLIINDLLNYYNFSNIIEIGTHDCGMSTLFSLYCLNSQTPAVCENQTEPTLYKNKTHHKSLKRFYTFDIEERDLGSINLIEKMGAVFEKKDCFEYEKEISNLIKKNGRTLLLCDGGDKPKEINTFCKYLKSGDVIMGHDFFFGKNEEDKFLGKTWHGKELEFNDVKESFNEHGISPIFREDFDKVAWLCAIKN
jgi:hypothetical protein